MSVYSGKGKGWRYDFILDGVRYSSNWFGTKAEAREAEAKRREEIKSPSPEPAMVMETTPTAMGFLDLVNRRLDHVKAYNSKRHYTDHFYMAKRWIGEWEKLSCEEVSREKIQKFLLKRAEVSPFTANKDLRYLRALFNFGISRNWIAENPTRGLSFFPVEKRLKYIPAKGDVLSVIAAANKNIETQDYLWAIKETMGRMGEVNRLTWADVNLEERYVVLYTRKKKGGHLTPRKVPMTQKLFEVLSRRHEERAKDKPWVFWQRYWDRKKKEWVEGPYKDRKSIMKTLCKKAKVRYFRFHALRHLGASILDRKNVNLGSIQRLLGHENRMTTEIYLHSIGEAEQEAMKIFEKAG